MNNKNEKIIKLLFENGMKIFKKDNEMMKKLNFEYFIYIKNNNNFETTYLYFNDKIKKFYKVQENSNFGIIDTLKDQKIYFLKYLFHNEYNIVFFLI
jgi:hypothetical protein